MERNDINPWEWSKAFGFSQAVELTGTQQILLCSGQTAISPEGVPSCADMAGQVKEAMANLVAVLEDAGMTMADVVRLTIYTTDADELIAAYGSASQLLGANLPAMTVIVVPRLVFPELKVEIEATAAR